MAYRLDVLKMVLSLSKHQTPIFVINNKSINSGSVPEDMKLAWLDHFLRKIAHKTSAITGG